jgi:hypothetical protein
METVYLIIGAWVLYQMTRTPVEGDPDFVGPPSSAMGTGGSSGTSHGTSHTDTSSAPDAPGYFRAKWAGLSDTLGFSGACLASGHAIEIAGWDTASVMFVCRIAHAADLEQCEADLTMQPGVMFCSPWQSGWVYDPVPVSGVASNPFPDGGAVG